MASPTIGILGGGQLGRMLAVAASRLGIKTHIYCPDPASPAFEVAAAYTVANYEDLDELEKFAGQVDVMTFEFENIAVQSLFGLQGKTTIFPAPNALAISQDRKSEKDFLNNIGLGTAPFFAIDDAQEIEPALATLGGDAILKTRRFGYDGKGQIRLSTPSSADNAWNELGSVPCVLEQVIPFDAEVSVIVARDQTGATAPYVPVVNVHRNHILHTTTAPADLDGALQSKALHAASTIVDAMDYVGVMGVEMFVVGGDVLINEIAPRVHNSGHWTMDGAASDQFEQHIRAVAGYPLGDPSMIVKKAIMTNLIGDEVAGVTEHFKQAMTRLHLYGKAESRPGRKMGHVTRLFPY